MYTQTKTWKDGDLIKCEDILMGREIYLPIYTWVTNPNDFNGIYKKRGSEFSLGIEEGYNWWALGNPIKGRYEWRVKYIGDYAYFRLLSRYEIKVKIYENNIEEGSKRKFLYKGKVIEGEEDLLLQIYLDNVHDFGNHDMVFLYSKRKYDNKLYFLEEEEKFYNK